NLRVDAIALDLLDGRLTADAAMEHVESTPRSRIHLALTGISLQALKSSLPDLANQSVPVTGTLDATADAAWVGSPANVNAHSNINVRGSLIAASHTQSQTFPLNANVHVNYDGRKNLITVPASLVQLPA